MLNLHHGSRSCVSPANGSDAKPLALARSRMGSSLDCVLGLGGEGDGERLEDGECGVVARLRWSGMRFGGLLANLPSSHPWW